MDHTPPGGVHQVKSNVHPAFQQLRQRGAQQVAQQIRDEQKQLEETRARALAQPTDEQIAEQHRRDHWAASQQAAAKIEAERQAGLQRQAGEKAQHQAEIRLLGRAIADELRPDFQALTAAIRDAIAQMKEPK